MKKKKKIRTTVYIDDETRTMLGIAAAVTGQNFTEIFKEALNRYFIEEEIKEKVSKITK